MTDHQVQIIIAVIGAAATLGAAIIGLLKLSARKKENEARALGPSPSAEVKLVAPIGGAVGALAAQAVVAATPVPIGPSLPEKTPPPVPGRLPSVPDLAPDVLDARFRKYGSFPCEPLRPHSIMTDLRSAPPLQREERARHYHGIRVRWSGLFTGVRRRGRDQAMLEVMIRSSITDEADEYFFFHFPEGPGWSLLRYGLIMRVEGVIENADRPCIELSNVVILEVS